MMRKFFTIVLSLLTCTALSAQDPVSAVRNILSKGRVTMDYSYTVKADVPLVGNGTITVDGNAYEMEGNGLRIVCDGKTKWTLDEKSREAYIEDSKGMDEFLGSPEVYAPLVSDLEVTEKRISGTLSETAYGAPADFVITGIRSVKPSLRNKPLTVNIETLGKDWIITDLR